MLVTMPEAVKVVELALLAGRSKVTQGGARSRPVGTQGVIPMIGIAAFAEARVLSEETVSAGEAGAGSESMQATALEATFETAVRAGGWVEDTAGSGTGCRRVIRSSLAGRWRQARATVSWTWRHLASPAAHALPFSPLILEGAGQEAKQRESGSTNVSSTLHRGARRIAWWSKGACL